MTKIPKATTYRNRIDASLGILPNDIPLFDTKKHSRTKPESKRKARKRAHASRKVNRGR